MLEHTTQIQFWDLGELPKMNSNSLVTVRYVLLVAGIKGGSNLSTADNAVSVISRTVEPVKLAGSDCHAVLGQNFVSVPLRKML